MNTGFGLSNCTAKNETSTPQSYNSEYTQTLLFDIKEGHGFAEGEKDENDGNTSNWDIQYRSVRRSFRQKVNQLQKKEVFNADGRHTFFIPVDEGFKV